MKNIIFSVFIMFSGLVACTSTQTKENPLLKEYTFEVDSLSIHFTENYNLVINTIYNVSEDSALADSLSQVVQIPDSLLFYQYLDFEINKTKDTYYNIQQEIFFAQDQLKGLTEDANSNDISDIQLNIQLEAQRKMLSLLKDRVDSAIKDFNQLSIKLRSSNNKINEQ